MLKFRTAFLRSSSVTPASGPPAAVSAILLASSASRFSSPPTFASEDRRTSMSWLSSRRPNPESSNSTNADCRPASWSGVSFRGVQFFFRLVFTNPSAKSVASS